MPAPPAICGRCSSPATYSAGLFGLVAARVMPQTNLLELVILLIPVINLALFSAGVMD